MKIEDLKVGDELVCVDWDGFIGGKGNTNAKTNAKILKLDKLIVTGFEDGDVFVTKRMDFIESISGSELKYFKKKEQYTFNDLIDVAVQAYKDDVIRSPEFDKKGDIVYLRLVSKNDSSASIKTNDISKLQEFIKSLYKETFVIESVDDIERIKIGARIILKNGNDITVLSNNGVRVRSSFSFDELSLVSLKGATVEQERSR